MGLQEAAAPRHVQLPSLPRKLTLIWAAAGCCQPSPDKRCWYLHQHWKTRQCCCRLLQDQRREADAAVAAQIDSFLEQLDACRDAQQSFTVQMNDPAGNSYIESPSGHVQADPQLKVRLDWPFSISQSAAQHMGCTGADSMLPLKLDA